MRGWLVASFLVFLVGCIPVHCGEPYIRYGNSCCLDEDKSGVCDVDEVETIELQRAAPAKEVYLCPDGTLSEDFDCGEVIAPSWVTLIPVKDNIGLIDEAIFNIMVANSAPGRATFEIESGDENWRLLTNPVMYPIRLYVKGGLENSLRLILQPDKSKLERKKSYDVPIYVTNADTKEKITVYAIIYIT
ncbi:hypothetical protein GOV09_00685 [Candidatus Woesearchaeota archaeon]|nr:hypothetical protein [Candidatus Woesearchaeota archaeon]